MLPQTFSELFTTVWGLAFIVIFLGGSVFIHELGHFLAARKRGLKIERFSIGFGPRIFGWTRNGIDYRISLLPFGGYVALPQMADMGMIEGETQEVPSGLPPISYADKMIVAVMGAVFNVIFALTLACILWVIGVPSNQQAETTQIGHVAKTVYTNDEEEVPGPAYAAGLKPGDIVLEVDGRPVKNYKELVHYLAAGTGRDTSSNPKSTLKIKRGNEERSITVQPVLVSLNRASGERARDIGIDLAYPLTVHAVFEDSPAHRAQLMPDDHIVRVDDTPLFHIRNLIDYLKDKAGEQVELHVMREGELHTLTVQAESVPYTKPIAELRFDSGDNAPTLEVITLFPPVKEGDEDLAPDPANPQSSGKLIVYQTLNAEGTPLESLQFGDILHTVNGNTVTSVAELVESSRQLEQFKLHTFPRNLTLDLGSVNEASITPPNSSVMLGFQGSAPQTVILHLNPLQQFYGNVKLTLVVLNALISPKSDVHLKNLAGPITIGRVIHRLSHIDFRQLLSFIVFININLAILNLLPIPVLDGGHMLMATIARLRGKPLPVRVMTSIQGTFMIGFLCLMFYILFFDSLRWWGDEQAQNEADIARQQYEAVSIPRIFRP